MPIISQTTWDKFTQEEKDLYRKRFSVYKQKIKNTSNKDEKNVIASVIGEYYVLFGEENLLPQALTYDGIAMKLFESGYYYYDYIYSRIEENSLVPTMPVACTSQKQAEKLLAINKLLNVAKFLNKDWKPDYNDENTTLYTFGIDTKDNSIKIIEVRPYYMITTEIVYFEEKELAEKALQILGEDTVRLALTTDW